MSTRGAKIAFSALWLIVLAAGLGAWREAGVSLAETPDLLGERLSEFGLIPAATLYILLYTLRPLLFFPATVLTVTSGLIFGPWLGIAFTVIGENASANFAFALSRWLGRNWVSDRESDRVRGWNERIKSNAIVAVMVMRLIYLPFDAVNYGCGLTAMRQRDFFIGTFIGIIPGLVSFVLLGGAGAAGVENRAALLASAIVFFFLGLVIARALRRRARFPAEVVPAEASQRSVDPLP